MSARFPGRSTGLPSLLAASLLVLLPACASSGGAPDPGANPFGTSPDERGEVQIRILNANFADATIWAMAREGKRTRLGVVTGKSDAVFTLPWRFSDPMRIEFDLLADVRCMTESLVVDPGDVVELQISVDPSSDPQCSRG